MLEHGVQNTIRNALAGLALIFRANVGQGWTGTGRAEEFTRAGMVHVQPGDVVLRKARRFSTGLPKGFSDLFGLVPVTITQDMVGQRFARFVALEVKAERGRASTDQSKFIAAVEKQGGLAGVVRTPAEALALVGQGQ